MGMIRKIMMEEILNGSLMYEQFSNVLAVRALHVRALHVHTMSCTCPIQEISEKKRYVENKTSS